MSKFHVGDRVRVSTRSTDFWHGDIGLVAAVLDLANETYYHLVFEGYPDLVAFVEYELRPADIRAYDPRPEPGDGPEYHADLAYWKARNPDDVTG